ncbi:unknown [Prevotella sp. CAG:487]|nr:unknown [Prevotella sp. CAG:487]
MKRKRLCKNKYIIFVLIELEKRQRITALIKFSGIYIIIRVHLGKDILRNHLASQIQLAERNNLVTGQSEDGIIHKLEEPQTVITLGNRVPGYFNTPYF